MWKRTNYPGERKNLSMWLNDSGKEFLNILTGNQRNNITAIPELQRNDLQEIIDLRRAIVLELRKFLKGGQADREKVIALGRCYGSLDGEMSYYYATAFAKVNRTLATEQRKALAKLRGLEGYTSAPAYIYSDPVRQDVKLSDSKHFFFPDGKFSGVAKWKPGDNQEKIRGESGAVRGSSRETIT